MKTVTLLLPILFFLPSCSDSQSLELVPSVDLNKFSGKWFEIASYPAVFQKGCRCTTAEYELMPDKKYVGVTNRCIRFKHGGSKIVAAKAKAFPVKGYNNAWLKVQFFWPFRGDYLIIGLADNYDWAIVGHPKRKYLWILSRESYMPSQTYDEIIEIIRKKGYDPNRLVKTPQNCDMVE
jgi:apolipoprotein D and lipocalin family protein